MALNREQRKRKKLAEQFLHAQNMKYDEELDKFHQKIISDSDELLTKALDFYASSQKEREEKEARQTVETIPTRVQLEGERKTHERNEPNKLYPQTHG